MVPNRKIRELEMELTRTAERMEREAGDIEDMVDAQGEFSGDYEAAIRLRLIADTLNMLVGKLHKL